MIKIFVISLIIGLLIDYRNGLGPWYKEMNLIKQIRDLEAKGVFIHLSHEHYSNGSNCNWSVEFTKFDNKNNQTSWFGDNHEFGDTIDCYTAAFKLATFLLEGDNLEWYFFSLKETVTEEGHSNWLKYIKTREEAHTIVFGDK
jgi:hypothetical protein